MFTTVMTECPHEHRTNVPSAKEESVGDHASRLSVRGEEILHRLLVLLPTYLESQQTPHASSFPPTLLFSICDALQRDDPGDGSAKQMDTSVLPLVLNKLRDWRLLDLGYRCSPGGIHNLALALAEIKDQASALTSPDLNRTSHIRLRMRWVGADPPCPSQNREPFPSMTPSPSSLPSPSPPRSTVLGSVQYCTHAFRDLKERRSGAEYETCLPSRRGTPDSEVASAVVSRRHPSVSGFRSGCSACRHPRVSGPPTPPTPPKAFVEQSTASSDVYPLDTNINPSTSSSQDRKPNIQQTTTKKTKRENVASFSHGTQVDENEPPLPARAAPQQGIGVSFPRPRTVTHAPRISNAMPSRELPTPDVASLQRRREPRHLPNHTREGDKHTVRHRVVASVDLRLHMSRSPNPARASPIDLHAHLPTTRVQTQSFSDSYAPGNAHAHGLGSVAGKAPKLSSNAMESQSSHRLPLWGQSHRHRHPATTPAMTTMSSAKLVGSSSPPAKASRENLPPFILPGLSSTSIPSTVLDQSGMKHRDRRSALSHTHKQTRSVDLLPFSPLIPARKWQV